MSNSLSLFDHTFIDNHAEQTLFLLHGTGGTKNDFLFLDDLLQQKYNLVGLQGNVNENGMARFFHRFEDGSFDQDSIARETEKLTQFLTQWHADHNFGPDQITFLGYSNGANMILATAFLYPSFVQHAVILHPMIPFAPQTNLDLSHTTFLLSSGRQDTMLPPGSGETVAQTLKQLHATVTHLEYPTGHEITPTELQKVVQFLLTE